MKIQPIVIERYEVKIYKNNDVQITFDMPKEIPVEFGLKDIREEWDMIKVNELDCFEIEFRKNGVFHSMVWLPNARRMGSKDIEKAQYVDVYYLFLADGESMRMSRFLGGRGE